MLLVVLERSLIRHMFLTEFNAETAGCSRLVLAERKKCLVYFGKRNGEKLIQKRTVKESSLSFKAGYG